MKRRTNSGSTLLLSLWVLVLLSAVILAWAKSIDQEIRVSRETNFGMVAKAMAHSGAAVALHPLVSEATPLLANTFGDRGYHATITGEGGKLNLNWLLLGEDPSRIALLRQYLEDRGLTLEQTDALVDSLLDWVGPAGLTHLNGAPEVPGYSPPHRPFASLDEVALVRNSGPLTALPGWRDDFTLYSMGPVDLLAAPLRVLRVLPGVGEDRAKVFLQVRRGPDGIDGTPDDHVFAGMPEIMSVLGMNQAQFAAMSALVGMNDPTKRIRSFGWEGSVVRELDVVARKSGATPAIFLWQEL
jgi:type II secretory pathway component PulK